MEIWNFVHNFTPFHVYELAALVVLAVAAVSAVLHKKKNNENTGTAEQKAVPGESDGDL